MRILAGLALAGGLVALLQGTMVTGSGVQTCDVPRGYHTIQEAVDNPICEIINVDSGTYRENVIIVRSVTILGQGRENTTVDGMAGSTVFKIQVDAQGVNSIDIHITLAGMTITNSDGDGISNTYLPPDVNALVRVSVIDDSIVGNAGYGIFMISHGKTTISTSVIDTTIGGNRSGGISMSSHSDESILSVVNSAITGNSGGGIRMLDRYALYARMEVVSSTISGNSGRGIAVGSFSGAHVTDSTISGNSGGGIAVAIGPLYVTNSTVSGNTAEYGGGLVTCGWVNIRNSTLSGNEAAHGGGIYVDAIDNGPYACSGRVDAASTIVANSPSGGECVIVAGGLFFDEGYNIVEDGTCIEASTSYPGDPALGPLQDNGGPTSTHALLPGSIAIDAGDNLLCPATDQRGLHRPVDGNNDGLAVCDIGSYEYIDFDHFYYMPVIHK